MVVEDDTTTEGQGDPKTQVATSKEASTEEPSGKTAPTDNSSSVVSSAKKHPLQNKWQLWYWRNEKGRDWIDNLLKVAQFDTVEDFWALYNHIELASNLQAGSDYCLFKVGIKPMWEDEGNKKGGRWLICVQKKNPKTLDEMWLECLLCLVGEAFEDYNDQICGAVINVRPRLDKISIWTSDCKNMEAILKIGKIIKSRTGYQQPISYEAHEATQNKTGSSAKVIMTL